MRKAFLIIGILCAVAALVILSNQKNLDPRPKREKRKANPRFHRHINYSIFSPDGEKLFFRVADESGAFSLSYIYIYTLSEKSFRKLPISGEAWGSLSLWAADSNRIAYGMPGVSEIFNIETNAVEKRITNVIFGGWSLDGTKQLFHNSFNGDDYIRSVDDGSWTVLPKEIGKWNLRWTYDSTSLIYLNMDIGAIMQYDIRSGDIKNLTSLEGFQKHFHTTLFPSRYSHFVYFNTPEPFTDSLAPVILQKLDIRSGRLKEIFETGTGLQRAELGKVYLTLSDDVVYFVEHNFDQERKWKGNSLIKLDTLTGETENVLEGYKYSSDYSDHKDIFSIISEDRKGLCLFNAKTRVLEQIYPPEETA